MPESWFKRRPKTVKERAEDALFDAWWWWSIGEGKIAARYVRKAAALSDEEYERSG